MNIHQAIEQLIESEHYEEKVFYGIRLMGTTSERKKLFAPGIKEALFLLDNAIETSWVALLFEIDYVPDINRWWNDFFSDNLRTSWADDDLAYSYYYDEGPPFFVGVSISEEKIEAAYKEASDSGFN